MSKSKKLPPNCEIEILDRCFKRERPGFRLRFYNDDNAHGDYVSEVYYPGKGQRLKSAAYEICQRYGWLEFPPATGVLTKEELEKLETMVEDAIYDMEENPARYVPDPEKFWRDLFDWSDDDQEFFADGNDLLACGDPPIPEYDETHWTHHNYTHDIGRIIPKVVRDMQVSSGPRGIEIVKFSSGDMDGDWDIEAEFVRRQPGAVLTAEDKARGKETREALDAAFAAYKAVDDKDPAYRELSNAWSAASRAHEINRNMLGYADDDDYWDPEEFQYYAAQMNCYWTLLRYKRYEIWCAIHGEDPLGNVNAEHEDVDAVFEVTVSQREDGHQKVTTKHVSGNADLEKEAIDYIAGHTLEELKEIISENPTGRPVGEDRWGSLRKGWAPGEVTDTAATFVVEMKGRRALPVTPHHIRQVSCRGLQEDVLRMLGQIEKHFPETPCTSPQ